jgi:hypothetical protein
MTDEPADARQGNADLPKLDRPLTELTVDELMALKDAYAARGIRIYNSVPWEIIAPLLTAVPIYSKAFLETLARHNAEWLINAVHDRIRKNGRVTELVVGPENGAAATLVITGSTPDEALLAVLDLDVTAEELRGKELRWDPSTEAWRPGVNEDRPDSCT